MTTALIIPRRELRPGIKRYTDSDSTPAWDVYVDDRLVASEYVALADARTELDFAVWFALFAEAALSPNALITDEALDLALQVFHRLFSAEKIQEKALTARDKIIGSGIYSIQSDGSLSVLASSSRGKQSTYTVTSTCTCKDFFTRAHLRGGVCKHIAARMLLVLAQYGVGYLKHLRDALDTTPVLIHGITPTAPITLEATDDAQHAPPNDAPDLAFVDIGAADLAAALFLVQGAGTPVDIHVKGGALRLVAGATDLSLACLDGSDACSVRLEAHALAAVYEQLRSALKGMRTLTVFAATDGSVILNSQDTDFSATAQGTALLIATSEPIAPSTSMADTQTVDALFAYAA